MVKEARSLARIMCAMDQPGSRAVHRNMLAVATFGLLLLSIALTGARDTPASRPRLMLLYVGAADCAPCRAWQNNDGVRFRSSVEFSRLDYREVKSPTLRDVLRDEHWPDDLRSHRARLGRAAAVPLWLIIADDQVVVDAFGADGWTTRILPYLRAALH